MLYLTSFCSLIKQFSSRDNTQPTLKHILFKMISLGQKVNFIKMQKACVSSKGMYRGSLLQCRSLFGASTACNFLASLPLVVKMVTARTGSGILQLSSFANYHVIFLCCLSFAPVSAQGKRDSISCNINYLSSNVFMKQLYSRRIV